MDNHPVFLGNHIRLDFYCETCKFVFEGSCESRSHMVSWNTAPVYLVPNHGKICWICAVSKGLAHQYSCDSSHHRGSLNMSPVYLCGDKKLRCLTCIKTTLEEITNLEKYLEKAKETNNLLVLKKLPEYQSKIQLKDHLKNLTIYGWKK